MTKNLISELSLCSFRIKCVVRAPDGDERILGTATAFRYTRNDKPYLVTNWHNASGVNPNTRKLLDTVNGHVPTLFRVRVARVKHIAATGRVTFVHTNFDFPLYGEGGFHAPLYLKHPDHGEMVDVTAIPWPYADKESSDSFVLDVPKGKPNLLAEVGADVFILGFPLGLSGGDYPIWKRGSIATEPCEKLDGLPKLYVDTATRKGMSGSPVFFRSSRYLFEESKQPVPGATAFNFLGVYSGRVGAVDLAAC